MHSPARSIRIARGHAHRIRPGRSRRSRPVRSWRRHGRKAQVSAIATIFGLLLVVTFIANYLSTTLPQQMDVNDINHDLLVQNEVGRAAALLEAAATHGAVGTELTQPIVLGSAGLPPFAAADGGVLSGDASGSSEKISFGIAGSSVPSQELSMQSNGGAFDVQLRNIYAPPAEAAYDYGAVVFAQQGGKAFVEDAPPITVTGTAVQILLPIFSTTIGAEAGVGTAILGFQLTSEYTETFPSGGYTLVSGSIQVVVTTPFAPAWVAYINSQTALAGDATCLGVGSACTGPFLFDGPLGTVTITLPASITSVTLQVATYALSLD